MTDPACLLDSSADDFERALLGSAARDVGSPAARARCLAAVGSGVAVLATSQTSSAAVVLSVLKAVAVGVVLGTTASGAAFFVTAERGTNASGGASALSQRGVQQARPNGASLSAGPGADAAQLAPTNGNFAPLSEPNASRASPAARAGAHGEVASKAPSPPAAAAPPPLGNPPTISGSGESFAQAPLDRSLELEVQALDRARQALATGDARAALAALDRHQREFPHGVLLPESVFLRVQALLAAGQRPAASALGRRYLTTHSGSNTLKLRQLLDQEGLY